MEKFEYVDAKNKICVVVLKDRWGSTIAKGISRCSEDDTFNESAGLKLANDRAWKKYFDGAIKECEYHIKNDKKYIEYLEKELAKETQNLKILENKRADLEKETEELLSTL